MDEPMFLNAQVEEGDRARHESIERCIPTFEHACQCRVVDCGRRQISCQRMKKIVNHTRLCQRRINASCPVCKILISLCCYHAKQCTKDGCVVPFCMNIRQKLAEEEAAQKRTLVRREMVLKRRIELLQLDARNISGSS